LKVTCPTYPPGGRSGAIWYDEEGERVIYFAEYTTWTLDLVPSL